MTLQPFSGYKHGRRHHPSPTRTGGDGSQTLLHNLRTRPLTFVAGCLGLFAVLAVKTFFVRAHHTAEISRNR